jgi:hypothetical protein
MKTADIGEAMIAGGILIAVGLAWSAVMKPATEAYAMGIDAQCRDQMIAAALVEELALHCPGAADYGHTEGSIALCGIAGGRTPEQVARLPQCKDVAPVRLTEVAR